MIKSIKVIIADENADMRKALQLAVDGKSGIKVVGSVENGRDLIEKYPDENTAFIGFFMMNKDLQSNGIGSRKISDVCNVLKKSFTHIRLGYVNTNMQARNFWMKNGFDHTGIQSKGELYTVNILEKTL